MAEAGFTPDPDEPVKSDTVAGKDGGRKGPGWGQEGWGGHRDVLAPCRPLPRLSFQPLHKTGHRELTPCAGAGGLAGSPARGDGAHVAPACIPSRGASVARPPQPRERPLEFRSGFHLGSPLGLLKPSTCTSSPHLPGRHHKETPDTRNGSLPPILAAEGQTCCRTACHRSQWL